MSANSIKVLKVPCVKLIALLLCSSILLSQKVFAKDTLKPSQSGLYDVGLQQLYIECYGQGSPAIIIHSGFGGAGSDGGWHEIIKTVSANNQVCLYDRANLGKSTQSGENYNVEVMAKQLNQLLVSAKIKPPFIFVGHSFGSYPIKIYNHLYSDQVQGILLVDPTQYGMFANGIAKWNTREDKYDEAELERMNAELSGWNNPKLNVERVDLKASAQLIKQSQDFGNKPFVLLWSKNGVWSGGEAPDDWHPKTWERMKSLYAKAIDDMHSLSTDAKILFANTHEHNVYSYEPESVIKEINYLLSKVKQR